MVQQIIYTRCKPHRQLLNPVTGKLSDGKILSDEGIAIYNYSEACLDENVVFDPLFVETVFKHQNASKELGSNAPGRFSSYSYFAVEKGKRFCVKEDSWQYYEKTFKEYKPNDEKKLHPLVKDRSNGQRHRPEEHIKQCFIGDFTDYPCTLFGCNKWDAFPIMESCYYHDNNEPLVYLPEVDLSGVEATITREKVKQFIGEGRAECVKNFVAVVISEMSKSIEDRNFIVIKDEPQNVEMWIAALEYSLPIYLAKQISFSTNMVASQNLSMDNTYYVDTKGKYIKGNQKDAKEGGGKKSYFSMIVGIHPTAQGSSSITSGMNNVSFIFLDGQNKTIERSSVSIESKYFAAVEAMDEDIADFDGLLEELAELSFGNSSSDIYELFDAYKYLLDSSSNAQEWEYSKIKRYLAIFKKYEKAPYKWSQYLSEKSYMVYQKHFEQDYREGFALLKQIISMDHQGELKEKIEKYLVEKYLYEAKTKNIDVAFVTGLNKLINTIYSDMSVKLAQEFCSNIKSFIDLSSSWNFEQAYYIFKKLYESNNMPDINNTEWHKEEKNSLLIDKLFDKISEEARSSCDMLNYIKNAPIYLEIAVKGAEKDFESWSKYICDTVVDSKLEMVCGALLEIGCVTEKQYENFLIALMKAGKQTNILFKFVVKTIEKYGLTETSAIDFIKEYLNTYARRWNEIKNLVDLMSENDLGEKTESYAYDVITELINESSIDNSIIPMVKEYEKWRMGLKRPKGRAYNIVLGESLIKRNSDQVIEILDKYLTKDEIKLNDADMKYIMAALDLNVKNKEIFVKFYKLIKNSGSAVKGQLVSFDFENADSVLWYLRLLLTRPIPDWQVDFRNEIKEIEKMFYEELKDENVDKLEKLVTKELEKDSPEIKVYKEYFEKMRSQIKEDKDEEKKKAKEAKKEVAESSEKKGLFSKLFGKK